MAEVDGLAGTFGIECRENATRLQPFELTGRFHVALPTGNKFWDNLQKLIRRSKVVIDRPRGSVHPRISAAVYPVDYGYLEGTSAGDGEGIDVWRGSLANGDFDAIVCTVDNSKKDAEIKVLLGCSADDKRKIVDFLNQGAMAAILINRPPSCHSQQTVDSDGDNPSSRSGKKGKARML
jgi:inorganic pyrophosphatase